jgi:hypothetical protein
VYAYNFQLELLELAILWPYSAAYIHLRIHMDIYIFIYIKSLPTIFLLFSVGGLTVGDYNYVCNLKSIILRVQRFTLPGIYNASVCCTMTVNNTRNLRS